MPDLQLEPLPFAEAVEFFRKKGYFVSPDSWRDLWGAAHVNAFTVAKVTAMDVLQDIRKAVDQAIEKGISLQRFKADLQDLLARKGWMAPRGEGGGALKPWRLDTIYRTNVQSAYQAGRFRQMLETAPKRPYWMYDAVEDGRTRPTHAAHDGKVYRFDHPFWDIWYPPNGFNCRCTVSSLSDRQLQRRGLNEETQGTSLKPDPGFDYNVGLEAWKPDLAKYVPEARKILVSNGVGPPRTLDELQARLNRWKDGMAQTGIPTSTKPIRLIDDASTPWLGWARYQTGEIGIRSDVYGRIRRSLQSGRVSGAEEADAIETLVHELGHQLGSPLEFPRYNLDDSYSKLAQTVNDLWARHSAGNILRGMGLRYDWREIERLKLRHPSGYQDYVERMRRILRAAGIDEAEEKTLMAELNTAVAPADLSDRMWSVIRKRKPGFQPRGAFGEMLLSEDKLEWLLGELAG